MGFFFEFYNKRIELDLENQVRSFFISELLKEKCEAVFVWSFLLLYAEQLFHNLLVHGVPSADPRY